MFLGHAIPELSLLLDIPSFPCMQITTRYLPALLGSSRRRFKIRSNWNFDCACARCADPTEMGTNVDAVLCSKCNPRNSNIERRKELKVMSYLNHSWHILGEMIMRSFKK